LPPESTVVELFNGGRDSHRHEHGAVNAGQRVLAAIAAFGADVAPTAR
jgi:hypothetical protein